MAFQYESPTTGPGGDNDGDDAAADALGSIEASSGAWQLEAWSKSPDRLVAEAKAKNGAGFDTVFANAGKHSNGPVHPDLRPF